MKTDKHIKMNTHEYSRIKKIKRFKYLKTNNV